MLLSWRAGHKEKEVKGVGGGGWEDPTGSGPGGGAGLSWNYP